MTWIFIILFCSAFCTKDVRAVPSDIPSLIHQLINEWNQIDQGIHDISVLKLSKYPKNGTIDLIFEDIVKVIPEENCKRFHLLDQADQNVSFRKDSFVIIVSDVLYSVRALSLQPCT